MANKFKREYDHFSEVSSTEYFGQLLELLSISWLRPFLVKGLITSASAGAEGLVRSSRFALIEHVNNKDQEEQRNLKATIFNDLVELLAHNMEDDRYAIPAVDILGFLLDTCITGVSPEMQLE